VAVLAPSEDAVKPLAEALNRVLEDRNLRAIACPEGRFVGEEKDIRVFDVRHIKGLEFEAVFFVGLDKLVEQEPDLFDKYLYVGATRAATYLGVAVDGASLPAQLQGLSASFALDWRT
jgi:DNA helicase IV